MEPQGMFRYLLRFGSYGCKKKHPHFYQTGTNTHADFVVTGLQDEMLNKQLQYFTIFCRQKLKVF